MLEGVTFEQERYFREERSDGKSDQVGLEPQEEVRSG